MKNSKYYPWFVVALLWFVALLNYMDRQMLATMRPSMETDIPELVSGENFGRLMAIFLWIYALMSPISGIIADKLNRKWLIVGSLFVWSAVTYAMGLATTYNQVYWLRALMGVSEALYIPAGLALITDYHQKKNKITGHRYPHDRIIYGCCHRRIWSNYCSFFYLAHHFSLFWIGWNCVRCSFSFPFTREKRFRTSTEWRY